MQLRRCIQLVDGFSVLLLKLTPERFLTLERSTQRLVLIVQLVCTLLVGSHELVLALESLIYGRLLVLLQCAALALYDAIE